MKNERYFIVVEEDGSESRVETPTEADSASRRGAEVVEIVEVEYKIGLTSIKMIASTPY